VSKPAEAGSDIGSHQMKNLKFADGPLPERFAADAYVASSGKEFALPPDTAIVYLHWAKQSGLVVTGFDVWIPTNPGPTPIVGVGCDGDADACLAKILHVLDDHGPQVVFNIWMEELI